MLPKTAEYALRAVVWMARDPDQPASAEVLAEHTQVPRRYLHTVLQELSRGGLVSSRSGPGGGYVLSKPPKAISILDVVNVVAPLERIRQCPLGLRSHTKLCPLHRELDNVYAASEKALGRVSIAQLINSTSEIVPLCEVKK